MESDKELDVMVSIIIPVYNVAEYLHECIQSVISQTYKNYEVILVDDGSKDLSPQICDDYSEKYDFIRVIHKQNGGLSSARNAGIAIAKGSYLCFLDSDDCISSVFLETLIENAKASGADISICDYIEWDYLKVNYSELEQEMLLQENKVQDMSPQYIWEKLTLSGSLAREITPVVTAWGKIIRHDLYRDITFPEGLWHEDEFIVHKLLSRAKAYVKTSARLYYYRQRNDSITGARNKSDKRHLDLLDALEERIRYCKDNSDRITYLKMIDAYRQNIIMFYRDYTEKDIQYRLRWRNLISYLRYPCISKKEYIIGLIFSLNPKWYYYRFWGEGK